MTTFDWLVLGAAAASCLLSLHWWRLSRQSEAAVDQVLRELREANDQRDRLAAAMRLAPYGKDEAA